MMHKEDVAQVTEIDREAFSTQWPPPNYQHELRNQLAHHIVACDEEKSVEQPEVKAQPEKRSTGLGSIMRQLFNHNRFSNNELPPQADITLAALLASGLWLMKLTSPLSQYGKHIASRG